MSRQLLFAKAARSDQQRIEAWYKQPGSGEAARLLLSRLDAAIARLTETPVLHRAGPKPNSRMLVTQKHRVVYRVVPIRRSGPDQETIIVLRIYGPGQDS